MKEQLGSHEISLEEMYEYIDFDTNTYEAEDNGNPALAMNDLFGHSLWPIHVFVKRVLDSSQPGFADGKPRFGKPTIVTLPLGQDYRRMNGFMERVCSYPEVGGYVAIFSDCCAELKLLHRPFQAPNVLDSSGVSGADLFNDLLSLIREKARKKKYKGVIAAFEKANTRNFYSGKKYIDGLFERFSKLLVLRLDFGYRQEHARKIACAQAEADFARFLNNRRWNKLFEHLVGYIRKLEHGPDKGYHFHCILFFNGQKAQNDVYLASKICEYWMQRIAPDRGLAHNCNASKNKYLYCGIGKIDHADEVMRANLLLALTYLTKKEQLIGVPDRGDCKVFTKGELSPKKDTPVGKPRMAQQDRLSCRDTRKKRSRS